MTSSCTLSALKASQASKIAINLLEHEGNTVPCQNDISFKNPVAKYPVKNSSENLSREYLLKISYQHGISYKNIF